MGDPWFQIFVSDETSKSKKTCKISLPLEGLVSQLLDSEIHFWSADKELCHAQLYFVLEIKPRRQRHALNGPKNLLATILSMTQE